MAGQFRNATDGRNRHLSVNSPISRCTAELMEQDALCASLTGNEHEKLAELLWEIADEQGLTPGVHPGYRRLQPKP